jgi:hypothetical protein
MMSSLAYTRSLKKSLIAELPRHKIVYRRINDKFFDEHFFKIPRIAPLRGQSAGRVQNGLYFNRVRILCGSWLAWANIAVDDCVRIWFFVKVVVSAAKSASRITDSAACMFCVWFS